MNQILTKEDVSFWLNSDDYFLKNLAEGFIGFPPPREKNLIDILTFLSIFSLGCKEMGLHDLSKNFEKRIKLFVVGLQKMGYTKEKRREYVAKRLVVGPLERIIRASFGRAAYRMFDLKRETPLEKEGGKK